MYDSDRKQKVGQAATLHNEYLCASVLSVALNTILKNEPNLVCIASCVMRIAKTNLQNKANLHLWGDSEWFSVPLRLKKKPNLIL